MMTEHHTFTDATQSRPRSQMDAPETCNSEDALTINGAVQGQRDYKDRQTGRDANAESCCKDLKEGGIDTVGV